MKQGSTLFLRIAVLVIALVILGLCIVALPIGIREGADAYVPIFVGLYLPAIPFFAAIYQAMKLLNFIDNNQAFSGVSVSALKVIKYCAGAISAFFTLGSPYVYYAAQQDDAPGLVLFVLIIIFASFVIATFAALLQRLLKDAIAIKSENDLTV